MSYYNEEEKVTDDETCYYAMSHYEVAYFVPDHFKSKYNSYLLTLKRNINYSNAWDANYVSREMTKIVSIKGVKQNYSSKSSSEDGSVPTLSSS